MKKVIVYGNGAVGRGVYFDLRNYSEYDVVAFTVDRNIIKKEMLFGLPVVPFDIVNTRFPPDEYAMFIAVGYVRLNSIRRERYFSAKEMGYKFINFISPNAVVHPETVIGENCYVGHQCVISPESKLGNNVFVSPACTVAHDTIIDDHCFLSEGVSIAGRVNVGSSCFLGLRSAVRNKVSIGTECVIGAGAILLEDAKDKSVYLGEPATLLDISSDQLDLQ